MTPTRGQRPHNSLVAATRGDFKRLFSRLLTYDVLFKILYAATFGPLTTWLLTMLITATGAPVIGNTALIGFVLSPIGILTIVVIGTLATIAGFIEKAGLMVIGASRITTQKMTFLRTIWFVAKKIPDLLGLALLQTLITLIVMVPFGVLGGVGYKVLLSQYNINYYLTYAPPEFQLMIALGVILVIGLGIAVAYLYLRWLFTVPVVVFEGRRFHTALGRSRELMKATTAVPRLSSLPGR